MAERMLQVLESSTAEHGIEFSTPETGSQALCMWLDQTWLTQPGMTICCGGNHGDAGAFGCIALGIGTSQVRDVLAKTLAWIVKVKINVSGALKKGHSKDVIYVIRVWGSTVVSGTRMNTPAAPSDMTMEERMTVCNMVSRVLTADIST